MQIAQLSAEIREKTGKAESGRLRRQGRIPASVYGKEYQVRSIHVPEKDLEKIFKTKLGVNTLIELAITGVDAPKVLIKEVQGHPISRKFHHIDFYVVREDQKVKVWVPLHLAGRAVGVVQGGLLEYLTREVELLCPVGKIPEEIVVDVTELGIGKNIHLSGVKLPDGVELEEGYDPALVTIVDPKKIEAMEQAKAAEAAAAAAATQPAVAGAPAAATPEGTAAAGAAPAAGAQPATGAQPAAGTGTEKKAAKK